MGKGSFITTEVIEHIAQVASREAIAAYKSERNRMEKAERRRNDAVAKTKSMLKSYRPIKRKLKEELNFTPEEQAELRWKFLEDLMGDPLFSGREESVAEDHEKKRTEDYYGVYMIETALRLYKEECDKTENEERKRRYRELYEMYIAEQETTAQEIAAKENISEKTVYKDLDKAARIVAVYLFGFSAIR